MMTKKRNRIGLTVIAGIILISISSCNLSKKYEKEEEANIQAYLASHPTLHYEKKASGLYYLDTEVGTGAQVATGDSVFIMLNVYDIYENILGTNYDTPDTLKAKAGVGDFIAGFDEAVTYMKAGGKSMEVVPSYLAYGTSGSGLPAYTTLLYDIYLVRLKSNSKK
jgi:FKBP-type peptidyl-prolyl cis-trans isomerases 1